MENGNVFFILSDYMKNYSKMVKYNTLTKSIDKIIFEAKENEKIREYSCKNKVIVFSVLINDNNNSHDIYLYNIKKDELLKINIFPINIKGSLLWGGL